MLHTTISRELPKLLALTDYSADRPGAWTRKQELGHLIDSATNNHVRFAVTAIDGEFRGPGYAQDAWVTIHQYDGVEWRALVDLWYSYNSLLAHLIENVAEERLPNPCIVASQELTLGFVIDDYVLHMQHHLDHILRRENVTKYPR